jgi:hypothetical protein
VGLLFPLAPFIHWVVRLAPVDAAFDTFLIPLLGIIFLRFGTSIEVILYVPGIGLNGRRWFWVILAALFDACYREANYARWNQVPGYVARERSGVWQELTTLGLRKERNSPCAAG